MKETRNGLKYDARTEIKEEWGNYDKTVAKCHLSNYGKIFVDEYDSPIDNDDDLAEIEEEEGLWLYEEENIQQRYEGNKDDPEERL